MEQRAFNCLYVAGVESSASWAARGLTDSPKEPVTYAYIKHVNALLLL